MLDQNQAISTIPLDRISSFLSKARIVSPEEFEKAPYVIAGDGGKILSGKADRIYARGNFSTDIANYNIYRKGEIYKDPVTREVLGMYAGDVGAAKMRALDNDVATLTATRSKEEIRIEDRLLETEDKPINSTFTPSAPVGDLDGVILAVENGVTQVGKMDVVIINRGEREGLVVGNVLAVYKHGEQVRDPKRGGKVQLPDERAGLVMVFRTFEKLSLGLILESDRPLSIADKVKNP